MSFVSYAQNYEDVMLFRALRGIEHGFYIDVGAQDPVGDSVTKAFYEKGWRGINIEPVAHWFQRLVADRPHDINLQVAVSDGPGKVHLFEVVDSGLSTTDPDFAKQHALAGYQICESDVDCLTLEEICKSYPADEIHFLKIDCEGGEAAALRGLSLERIRPWIIVLEATAPNSLQPVYMEWELLLTGCGYHFVYEDGLNRFYVADEHGELDSAFSHPPNVFDYFVRAPEAALRRQLEVAQGDLLVMREAQRVVRAESECEQLRARAEYLRGENERLEAALVEHRRLLAEAEGRETQGVARTQAEHEQLRANIEYLRSENDRREAALVEHRRLLDEAAGREAQSVAFSQAENERREAVLDEYRRLLAEAAERETQGVARTHAEHEQLRADIEYLRSENERREAALAEHRGMLGEAAEREAQGVVRLQAEHERSEAALAQNRRLLDEATERDAQCMTCVQAEREQWRTDLEYLRSENGRREAELVEHRRLLGEAAEREAQGTVHLQAEHERGVAALAQYRRLLDEAAGRGAQSMARMQAEREQWRTDIEYLRSEKEDREAALDEHRRLLENELSRFHREVALRDQEVDRLHQLIQAIHHSASWRITSPLRGIRHGSHWLAHNFRRAVIKVASMWIRTLVRVPGMRAVSRRVLLRNPEFKQRLVGLGWGKRGSSASEPSVGSPMTESEANQEALSRSAREALSLLKEFRSAQNGSVKDP